MAPERRFGEALKRVVSEAYESAGGAAAKSPLMHANRRRVFEYVAWHPCCTVPEVARALAVSAPTASWHLRKLAEAGYVVERRHGDRATFNPAGLGLDDAELATLAALARPLASDLFRVAMETPGLTAVELAERIGRAGARRAARTLLAANVLVAVADGRYRRYYAGGAAAALERNAGRRLREFRRRLLRRLEQDQLAPEVRTAPGDAVEIEVRFGDERATIRVPSASLLAGRLG